MAAADIVEFVIVGTTLDGKPFRPSDWAERLCGVMSAFGKGSEDADESEPAPMIETGGVISTLIPSVACLR